MLAQNNSVQTLFFLNELTAYRALRSPFYFYKYIYFSLYPMNYVPKTSIYSSVRFLARESDADSVESNEWDSENGGSDFDEFDEKQGRTIYDSI